MTPAAGSAEAMMAFFLIQAVPVSAAIVRLVPARPADPSPGERRLVPFDGLLFSFLCLLLLRDLSASRAALKAEWILLAALTSAVYTLILSAELSSHAELRRFAGRILSPAPNLPWLVISLTVIPAVFLAGFHLGPLLSVLSQAAPAHPSFLAGQGPGDAPFLFLTNAIFAGGIGGEPFWRGVLYARLRRRRPFFRAAFVTGIAQAIWLVPGWLVVGLGLHGILLLSALFICASPVFAWIYERTHRSLLAVVLLFGSMMTAMDFIPLSPMTVGTVILFISAARLAEMAIRTFRRLHR